MHFTLECDELKQDGNMPSIVQPTTFKKQAIMANRPLIDALLCFVFYSSVMPFPEGVI